MPNYAKIKPQGSLDPGNRSRNPGVLTSQDKLLVWIILFAVEDQNPKVWVPNFAEIQKQRNSLYYTTLKFEIRALSSNAFLQDSLDSLIYIIFIFNDQG